MANEEQLVFDGLTLNDATFGLAEVVMSPPRERQNWIGAADSEFQVLTDVPRHDNRDITVKIQIAPQASMNTALDKVGLLVDKCVKASKYPNGIALTWTPATSTRTVTAEVLSAEITDLPIDWQDGWLALAPTVTIVMKAKPYLLGTEAVGSTTSTSTPYVSAEIANTSGDVAGLGRLIVTDTATQSRRHLEWGLEGPLTYNASTSLIIDSDSLVTSGFAGAQEVSSGAYDPNASGNNAVGAILYQNAAIALCGLGTLSHVGSYRVKVRLNATINTSVALRWRAGDGPMSLNPAATVWISDQWIELDLGTVTIPTVLAGTQAWTGQIEASSPEATGSAGIHVDYVLLVPTGAGYGKSRASYSYQAGVLTGYDGFTSTTAGNNLSGRAATIGGSWATAGDATDFVFADAFSAEQLTRTAVSGTNGRLAALGSSNFTDTEVLAKVYTTSFVGTGNAVTLGVVARYVDSSNYVAGAIRFTAVSGFMRPSLSVYQVVAGVATTIASESSGALGVIAGDTWYGLRLLAFASGRVILALLDSTLTSTVLSIDGFSSTLASGGTLDDGKPGLIDLKTGSAAATRYYDEFQVATPAAEPIVIYSGRNMQVRHDDTIRQDSTGTYTGRPHSYRGSRFLVPVGTSRVFVKARRSDIEAVIDSNVTDSTQIQVGVTPRYIAVPR